MAVKLSASASFVNIVFAGITNSPLKENCDTLFPDTMKLPYSFSFAALLVLSSSIFANDTAMNDGSAGPEPIGWRSGPESIIQMQSEHISVHFGIKTCEVTARFHFLSHKKSGPAMQKLGFPDYSRSEMDGDIIGPVNNLETTVNGKKVESTLVEGYYKEVLRGDNSTYYEPQSKPGPTGDETDDSIRRFAWHVIEAQFPPGEIVTIERKYQVPTGGNTMSEALFIYETRTGGAWRGVIEKLTAEVTFDPGVRKDLLLFHPKDGWEWSEDQSVATLVWENFEPRTDEERTYFEILTLNLEQVAAMHKESPKDFPSVEEWIKQWKKRNEKKENAE